MKLKAPMRSAIFSLLPYQSGHDKRTNTRRQRLAWQGVIVLFLLYSAGLCVLGAYAHKSGMPIFPGRLKASLAKQFITETDQIKSAKGYPNATSVEHIRIAIKKNDMKKLEQQRNDALAKGFLISDNITYVPAIIEHKGESKPVRLRLKGDWTDHIEGRKWSFRIKVSGNNTLFGMRLFSIQDPRTRSYLNEWLFHRLLTREDILGLRYEFLGVSINGKDLGIYALEEHFDKRLLEHSKRREGPIVRFDETLFWETQRQFRESFPEMERKRVWLKDGAGAYLSSGIDAFQSRSWLTDPARRSEHEKAIHLLEAFRRGRLKPSLVFDLEKLGRYLALTDLLGASHASDWHNIRFYYNPITARLEPIGFDADCGQPLEKLTGAYGSPYVGSHEKALDYHYNTILSDYAIFVEYVKNLERISQESYLDKLFVELGDELDYNASLLHQEEPSYSFNKEVFYKNAEYIRKHLDPARGLHAHLYALTDNEIKLELGNLQSMPIEVLKVSTGDSESHPNSTAILAGRQSLGLVQYSIVSFPKPDNFTKNPEMISGLNVHYRLLGTSHVRSIKVTPWSYLPANFKDTDVVRHPPNAGQFSFIKIEEGLKLIKILPGNWKLDTNLIMPKGYRVICGQGTTLNFVNAAKIISYSPIEFSGIEERPIVLSSDNSSGQGIVVMNTSKLSTLRHVTMKNLSNPSQSGWELTGSLCFFEAPVSISHCRFISNRSEDCLNIISSPFTIEDSLFQKTYSDAVDLDFSEGKITRTYFVNCGNDAIDASGSIVDLNNIFIRGTGDKGLSAGEESRFTGSGVDIVDSEIAIASKDMSRIHIARANITKSRVGLALYQKKPEFGPAYVIITEGGLQSVEQPYLVENGSELEINGETVKANSENVERILYGKMYGKASN